MGAVNPFKDIFALNSDCQRISSGDFLMQNSRQPEPIIHHRYRMGRRFNTVPGTDQNEPIRTRPRLEITGVVQELTWPDASGAGGFVAPLQRCESREIDNVFGRIEFPLPAVTRSNDNLPFRRPAARDSLQCAVQICQLGSHLERHLRGSCHRPTCQIAASFGHQSLPQQKREAYGRRADDDGRVAILERTSFPGVEQGAGDQSTSDSQEGNRGISAI